MTLTKRLDALLIERSELEERFNKLCAALDSQEVRNSIPKIQVSLMQRQRGLQGELLTVLTQRIKHLTLDAGRTKAEAELAKAAQQPAAEAGAEDAGEAVKKPAAKRKRTTTKKKASTTGSDTAGTGASASEAVE